MAYDQGMVEKVNEILTALGHEQFENKKMFGGVGVMMRGNMVCGVHKESFIARVGPDAYEGALNKPHARPFDITGRPMKGWVMVAPEGVEEDAVLKAWIEDCLKFSLTLPEK